MKRALMWVALCLLSGCGIVKYPGQPGVVTNGYTKIDLEDLQPDGLFVYEVVYDNSPGGKGVGAVITKLYPNAKTYTSNVRTNADGTVYRAKAQYDGAEVQMMSIPALNQIYVAPNSKVVMMVDYENSLDEVDDKNLSEMGLFKPTIAEIFSPRAWERKKFLWDAIRMAELKLDGSLLYEIASIEIGGMTFVPSQTVKVETNFLQTALRSNLSIEMRREFALALESSFVKGYKGPVTFVLKDKTKSLTMNLGLHTAKTAAAAGIQVIHNVSQSEFARLQGEL